MGANELLLHLRESGFSINAENSRLQIAPAESLTDELKQSIQDSKAEILCVLHRENELKRLVLLVSEHHGFKHEDYDVAIRHALEDQVLALTCFTALARQAGLI
jgi:hypothetical protein